MTTSSATAVRPPPRHHPTDTPHTQYDYNETIRNKRPRLNYTAGTNTTTNTQSQLPEAALPFYGDFRGTWWNSQALFASDATLQSNKHRYAWSLLAKADFTGFAETHSTIGHTEAASLPSTSKFFWSHGPTRWQAGVGLAVKHSFLQNFNTTHDRDWQEIAPGRAAKLSLRGPSGGLDLYVCYLPTGSQSEEQKVHIINQLRENISSNDSVLTILMGDWNFVMETEDRLCLRTMDFTGRADRPLARKFQTVLDAYQLHELEQPAFTHENTTAHSKIDRIYTNHHVSEQLDRQFSASTLPRTKLSSHKAITFARQSKQADDQQPKKVQFPSYVLQHEHWRRNLHLNYHEKLAADNYADNSLRRLELFKQAMWDVATTLQLDTPPEATSLDDKLSWTMIFIRAAESINLRRMDRAATAYSHITTFIPAADPNARIHPNFQALRNHARDLAHQQLTDELLLVNNADDNHNHDKHHRKQQLITRLARLVPGATHNIGAILTDNDDLAATPTSIANALKTHWEPIFQRSSVNTQLLQEWLNTTTNFHDATLQQDPQRRPTTPTTTTLHHNQRTTLHQGDDYFDDDLSSTTSHNDDASTHTTDVDLPSPSGALPSPQDDSGVGPDLGGGAPLGGFAGNQVLLGRALRQDTAREQNTETHQNNSRQQNNKPRTDHSRPRFPTASRDWQVRRKDIAKAIKTSGQSAPGPDGIPYIAWRKSGDLATQILHDAATALQSDQAITLLQEIHGDDTRPENHEFNLGLLICLGKKPHSTHPEHGEVFRPGSTRPLSIVNTDNRLLANAARLRWERLLNPWISPQQQGFLGNRSILKNVLDIDYAAMATALTNNHGGLVLFDFASAFPSISQSYMFDLLAKLGVPSNALNMIRALYDNNRCIVQTNGVQVDGFQMTAGVRQGCPLSPLLYAICAELLIERIRMEIPTALVRAYADDTAVLIQNLWTDTPVLARIFADFTNISNLHLNLSKTIVIPLFPQPNLSTVREKLTVLIPSWSAVQYEYSARYLGFTLGPEAGDKSWTDPVKKFLQRAQAWSDRQLGLHCTSTSYNIFALSVLTYIAQLLPPPQQVLESERTATLTIAPGPTNWVTTTDLVWLRHLTGHPRSLASLTLTCQAAQARVRVWDAACADHEPDPGTPLEWCNRQAHTTHARLPHTQAVQANLPNNLSTTSTFHLRTTYLQACITAPDEPYTRARWRGWFDRSMLLALNNNISTLQHKIGSIQAFLPHQTQSNDHSHWTRVRRKFQSHVYTALHQKHAPDAHARLAHKLSRWNLHQPTQPLYEQLSTIQRTPNWQARSAHQRLKTAAKLTTPRVHAALFGAIWNRWCTLRRFQLQGRCQLCQQPHTEDSIEHYPFCNAVKELATRRLGLCRHTQVNIQTFTCTNPFIRTNEQLTRAALLVYATYRALNHQRHTDNPLLGEELYNAMCQWVVEGARGHTPTCRTLASIWTTRQGTPLPRIH